MEARPILESTAVCVDQHSVQRTSVRYLVMVVCAVLLVGLSGCVAYYTFVNVSWIDAPPNSGFPKRWENSGGASVLTDAEVKDAAEVVGQVARQFGFSGSTDMTALRDCRGADESRCYDRNIGFYSVDHDDRKGDGEHGRVDISILVYKSTGRILIFIFDRDLFSFGPESYTTGLAESIKAALAERLPADLIEIAGHYYWPVIPP